MDSGLMNRQNDSILDVQSIVKDFGGLRAINHVSLKIHEGEVREIGRAHV